MQTGQYIGIDFGTTNTAVVHIKDDEFGRKITYLGENGENPFSSIVAIPKDGGALMFGRKVREQRLALAETHEVYTSMKSFLGVKDSGGEPTSFVVGGTRYYPQKIAAAFLRYIKDYIKQSFGIVIDAASFSFPVDFSPEARRELYQAANEAGIDVKAFVGEATAAYIANRVEGRAFSKVMVLDWGGGTIDVSILRLTGGSIHELSVWGDHVGGDDIDRELAGRIHARIAADCGIAGGRFEDMQPAEKDQMIKCCEEAKISISESEDGEDYPLTVRNYGAYGTKRTTITENQFNAIVEPLIRSRVLKVINDALNKAGGIVPTSIDAVIVVGGSSNLRLFEYAVANLFKDAKIIIPTKAQWSTAIGAGLMQIVGGSFRLSDSIGVVLSDDSVFTVLPKGYMLKKKINPITFSLTEDSKDAHFIFTDSTGKSVYAKQNVPTKGFLKEALELDAVIGDDQIARITLGNSSFGTDNRTIVEINKLTFHYDISALGESD